MNNGSNIIMKAAAVIMLTTAMACSKVNYTVSEDLPTETFVRYQLDWAGQTDVPSEMTVAMGRIINTVHFSCILDSLGNLNSILTDTSVVQIDSQKGLNMPNGEYYIVAFNTNEKTFKVSGHKEFTSMRSASMRDIYINAPFMTENEIKKFVDIGGGSNVSDFNPGFDYIKSISPAYLDVQKVNIHPEIDTLVTIRPVAIAQNLKFKVDIETDPEVEILKVRADISGVPGSIQLLTGQISDTLTYRVPFEMTRTEGTTYEGSVYTLGLFPSTDATYTTGPGILQLAILARFGESEKVFRAGINLQQSIRDAQLIEKASEKERLYRIKSTEAVLDVRSRLRIKKDNVVTEGDSEGVEVWFKHEDIEFEI